MAVISKIKLNNISYDLKDATARNNNVTSGSYNSSTKVLTLVKASGNVTIDLSAISGSSTSQYNVTMTANNLSCSGNSKIHGGESAVYVLTANNGYTLPTSLNNVTVSGATKVLWYIIDN